MSQPQIRLARTPDINKVLTYLRGKYQLLSEAEIIKLALSEKYNKEQDMELPMVDEETEKMIGKSLQDLKEGSYTTIRTKKELDQYLKSLG